MPKHCIAFLLEYCLTGKVFSLSANELIVYNRYVLLIVYNYGTKIKLSYLSIGIFKKENPKTLFVSSGLNCCILFRYLQQKLQHLWPIPERFRVLLQ